MIPSVLALVVVLSAPLINLSRCRSNERLLSGVSVTDPRSLEGFGVMLLRYFPLAEPGIHPRAAFGKQLVLLIMCLKYHLSFMHNLQSHAKHPPPIASPLSFFPVRSFASEGAFSLPQTCFVENAKNGFLYQYSCLDFCKNI